MSIFDMFRTTVGNFAGIKMLQNGSDVLINNRTKISTFSVNSALRKHADEVIKQHFLGLMDDMCVEEAAIIKLSIFYQAANELDQMTEMDLIGDAITEIRHISGDKIRPLISAEVMAETGC